VSPVEKQVKAIESPGHTSAFAGDVLKGITKTRGFFRRQHTNRKKDPISIIFLDLPLRKDCHDVLPFE